MRDAEKADAGRSRVVIGGEFAPPSHSLLQARLYDIPTFKNALSAHKETRNVVLEYAIFVIVVSDICVLLPDGPSNFKAMYILFLLRKIEVPEALVEPSKELGLCGLG